MILVKLETGRKFTGCEQWEGLRVDRSSYFKGIFAATEKNKKPRILFLKKYFPTFAQSKKG